MLFGTPTDLQFEHAVRMYEGTYQKIKTWDEFRHYVTQSLTTDGLHVMEVCTSRENNVKKHRLLWEKVSQEIAEFLEKGRTV